MTALKVGLMLWLVSTAPSAAIVVMAVIILASLVDERQVRRLPDDQRLKPLVRRPAA